MIKIKIKNIVKTIICYDLIMKNIFKYLVFLSMLLGLILVVKEIDNSQLPKSMGKIDPKISLEDEIVSDELLVLLDDKGFYEMDQFLNETGLNLLATMDPWILVSLKKDIKEKEDLIALNSSSGHKIEEDIKDIEKHPFVIDIKPNHIEEVFDSFSCMKNISLYENDLYRYQWYLHKDTGINLEEAWGITFGNKKQVVAVVDRNFAIKDCESRNYFYKNILSFFPKRHFDKTNEFSHGSQVLNVLAPCPESDMGIRGVDFNASIFLVDSREDKSLFMRLFSMLWAAGIDMCPKDNAYCHLSNWQKNLHPALVINASFGFAGPYLESPPYGPVLDAIGQINKRGQVIVASAGNEGMLADKRLPGSAGGVISVGASNREKKSALFSNFGQTVDVLAPGEGILGIESSGPIYLNGTSFAAPLVSGVVSLMLGLRPELSWKVVEHILKSTATPIFCADYCPKGMGRQEECIFHCCEGQKVICASGIVNAKEALKMAESKEFLRPLIDLDDYFISLSEENGYQTSLIVKNWGQKKASITLKSSDPDIKMLPKKLDINKAPEIGLPAYKEIKIFLEKIPKKEHSEELVFEAHEDGQKIDQIEGMVQVVLKKQGAYKNF